MKEIILNFVENILGRIFVVVIQASVLGLLAGVYFKGDYAKGTKFLYISIPIFLYFCYLQYKYLAKLFSEKTLIEALTSKKHSKAVKVYFKAMLIFSLLVFLYFLWYYYKIYNCVDCDRHNMVFKDSTLLATIWFVMVSLLFSLGIVTSLFSLFFLGPLSNGISLSIMAHNWFNGLGFKYAILLESFLDFTLPDALAFAVNVIWFLISLFLTNANVGNSNPST